MIILPAALIFNSTQPASAYEKPGNEMSSKKSSGTVTVRRDDTEKKLNDFMQRAAAFGYTGGVLVAKDGKILLEKGYGMANRADKIPFSIDTVFDIGSNVKDFTKMAILQLAAKGKINLSDSITKYFENVPPDKTSITIEQLVDHTAGLRANSGPDQEKIPREELIRRVFAAPLISEPGKEENYSNPGYSMLAAIIEIAGKQSFEQYVYENILKPAGMNRTGYVLPQWKPGEIAHSYNGSEDNSPTLDYPHLEDGNSWNLRGNGGMLSTLGDMFKFHLALETEKLLSKDLKEQLFPQNSPIMLVGGDGVHNFVYNRDPANKIVIISASTDSAMQAAELSQQLLPLVQGKAYKLPPQTIKIETSALTKYEGTYKLPSGVELNVTAGDGGILNVSAGGQEAINLLSGYDASMNEEFNESNERAGRIVEGGAKGDYVPLFEAFGKRIPLEQIKMRQSVFWQQQQQRFGAFKGFKVIGTTSNRKSKQEKLNVKPFAATLVRLDFEKGPAYVQYIWDEGRLAGVRPLVKPAAVDFLPQSRTTFANYTLATGDTNRIGFNVNDDGSVKELVIAGNVRATKTK